jgi:hypothetical protein
MAGMGESRNGRDRGWEFSFRVGEDYDVHECHLAVCGGASCPTCGRTTYTTGGERGGGSEPCCAAHALPPLRSRERLEARKDRTCKNCGATFTPKNSLGTTCSTRCRVALHRKPPEERERMEREEAKREAQQKAQLAELEEVIRNRGGRTR